MSSYLHAIGTAVPETVMPQALARDLLKEQPELNRLGRRLVGAIFNASAIDQRHTAVSELGGGEDEPAGLFFDPASRRLLSPSTGARNDFYAVEAAKLFVAAAERALAACEGVEAGDITHVVTVSCTGFFAPGPDYAVVRALGLAPSVQRFHLGFMGCYAAFPALKLAKAFCEADPQAVVLVVCAELCSIHMRASNDPDSLIASSVFADGAAAALISATRPPAGSPALRLDHFETTLTPVGERDMAWKIGDQGFEMVLSTYVPHIIEEYIRGALVPLLAHGPALETGDVERWAIHPGGRSILDKIQQSLGLSDAQLHPSREVLRTHGNMSSATVLFVLERLLSEAGGAGERVCAMAFGPGLTVETGLMTRFPAVALRAAAD